MNKLFLIAISSFILFNCSRKDVNLTVDGQLSNFSQGMVYLEKVGTSQIFTIDSTAIDNGSFFLEANISEEAFYRLQLSNGLYASLILKPGEHLIIDGDATDFEASLKVQGSESSEKLREVVAIQLNMLNKKDSLTSMLRKISSDRHQAEYVNLLKQLQNVLNQYPNQISSFNAQNKGDLATLTSVELLELERYPQAYIDVYNALHAEKPNSEYTVEFEKKVSHLLKLQTGNIAPDFSLYTPQNEVISLSSLRGQYVLLDFWASWCKPCRMENPNIVKAYHKYKADGFTVFSVSLDGVNRQGQDPRAAWEQAIHFDGLTWPNHGSELMGWQSSVVAQYGITSIPKSLLLDPNGEIIAHDLRGNKLEEELAKIFKH